MAKPLHPGQHGLSLVELLVGIALGLVVVAATILLLGGQLREHRNLAVDTRLMQDLRTASDIVTRDLRRAGHWGDAAAGVWSTGASGVAANPYVALTPTAAASDAASFRYSRDTTENHVVDTNEQFGLRLRNGAIELLLGAGSWQSLTDAGTLTVTTFRITPVTQELDLSEHCATPCPAATPACGPRQQVRSLAVDIQARSAFDPQVIRSLHSDVRVRNDAVTGACPA